MVTSLRGLVPSPFARNSSLPFTYASCFPSSDQRPPCPTASPSLRGEPPSTGTLNSGPLVGTPIPSTTNNCDPSCDSHIGNIVGVVKIGSPRCSPPVVDISDILAPLDPS